ncbi:hypothetical protein [Motilimonas eburnea]|uniref:hypothetical protein n=1 Tax=Motilimonas eburnea TaxID=1737488 RepID=UPI001E5A17E7|nr:hypothetical protein [Motilimonas eburnea]MCE2571727.1 hypothetical protein [Motilimonas eburnea]
MKLELPIANTGQPIATLANEVLIHLINNQLIPKGYVLAKSYPLERIQALENGTSVVIPLAYFKDNAEISGEAVLLIADHEAQVNMTCSGKHLLRCCIKFEQPCLCAS